MQNNLAIKKSNTDPIASGSIRINSTEELERLLKLFPSDPKLIKSYADLLSKENFLDSALRLYQKAAALVCLQKVLDKSGIKIRKGSGPKYLLSVR
jgi:hypothetical protein